MEIDNEHISRAILEDTIENDTLWSPGPDRVGDFACWFLYL